MRTEIIREAILHAEGGEAELKAYAQTSKFDGQDPADKELLAACSILQLGGVADEEVGATDELGFFWRIDNVVCCEDGEGFIGGAEFSTPGWATVKMEEIERALEAGHKAYVKEAIR